MAGPGLIRYLDAIRCVGPRVLPEWTGAEHVAASAAEDDAYRLALCEAEAGSCPGEWCRSCG
jgi:hypothetical protein